MEMEVSHLVLGTAYRRRLHYLRTDPNLFLDPIPRLLSGFARKSLDLFKRVV